MKNAYLVVTDLHYAPRKEHRVNYFGEVINIITQILELSNKYKNSGYTVNLIFLGDVVDGSISNPEEAMRCLDLFRYLSSEFNAVYTVLGNHEENNTINNPFWYLVSELGDSDLSGLSRALQPQSIYSCISIPDKLVDGEVTIYFNHYGVTPKTPTSEGVNIGLFHQNIGSEQICTMWGKYDDVEVVPYVQAYNFLYFGHMHLGYGKYELNDAGTCIGEWLGSCIGTNVVEVETLAKDLNIPAILVEDGVFYSIEDNNIKRQNPKDVIDYTRLEITKAANEFAKIKKEVSYGPTSSAQGLYERVLESAVNAKLDQLFLTFCGGFEEIRRMYKSELGDK